jgi:hypothetical protein
MREEGLRSIKSYGEEWEELLALGLESPQRYRTRRDAIKNAKMTVLMEQERYRKAGYPPDEQDLCLKSQCVTNTSKMEALCRANVVASQVHPGLWNPLSGAITKTLDRVEGAMHHLEGRSMSTDELEMSFEPPPSKTRKRVSLFEDSYYRYPVDARTNLGDHDDEERQTVETIECRIYDEPQHEWNPVSDGPHGVSDYFALGADDSNQNANKSDFLWASRWDSAVDNSGVRYASSH